MSVIEETQMMKGDRVIRVMKRSEQLDDSLVRLADSMRKVLIRRYTNPVEREAVAAQIMQRVRTAA